jgi:peroxiredoxin
MKKLPSFTAASFVLSAISIGLTFYQYKFTPAAFDCRIIAGLLALLSFFTIVKEFMKFTGPYQLGAMIVGILALGVSIDPIFHSIPFITISLLIVFGITHKEFFFRSWFSETDGTWMSYAFVVLSVLLYVYGNIFNDLGWAGWVFPAPIFLFSTVMFVRNSMFGKTALKYISDKKLIHEAGKSAPDFSLRDHEGNEVKLSDYRGKRDVLLMFVRNAWCPSCHIMLRTYNRNSAKFQEKNILLFAIGPNVADVNKQMAIDLGIDFKVLSDEGLKTAMAYRVHLPSELVGKEKTDGMALPASFLIDKKGIIRYTSRPDRIGEFLDPMTIFPVLESLN